ncbi:Gypsy retrotransposon integrase-like protein 1 [Elysia marginata]|uniref:Gypsy retrotransposon integrase-like protein 1 n=1 Tax=Elysia marginata TaxID=1093978 RepID=A0AAV4HED5_9GAST|nr:Gypsy retrotransposon integrase-like protein 1 [Elysia marginata]
MSVAHDYLTGAHLGIRRTKDKVRSNFYWPGVDGDVTRYCRSCDVCQRTVKKVIVPIHPDTHRLRYKIRRGTATTQDRHRD